MSENTHPQPPPRGQFALRLPAQLLADMARQAKLDGIDPSEAHRRAGHIYVRLVPYLRSGWNLIARDPSGVEKEVWITPSTQDDAEPMG